MVVFTCQNCGESLHKQKVEKHILGKCRNRNIHLTCVDCLKDFGHDYQGHTDCMTEEQRYAATGTVFKPAKGKNKQQMYMKMIQQVLNSDKTLTVSQRRMLEMCSKHDNVPRKIGKFKNFITNVVRNSTTKDVNRVFEVIEEAWKSMSLEFKLPENKEIGLESKESKGDITDFKGTSNVLTELKGHDNDRHQAKKSRKKNHHLLTENEEDTIEDGNNTATINTEPIESKKKRKSGDKNSINTEEEKLPEGLTTLQNKEENMKQITKKELKKQMKYQKYLAELENMGKTELGKIEDEQVEESDRKQRKKKLKKIKVENLNDNNGENSDYVSHMAVEECTQNKTKKRKMENSVNGIEEKKKKVDSLQEEGVVESGIAVFNWSEVIMRVLESRPDKELSLKRLSKKVIDEYQTVRADHRTYEELLARFNKKVNKTPGVRVLKDRAKLIE